MKNASLPVCDIIFPRNDLRDRLSSPTKTSNPTEMFKRFSIFSLKLILICVPIISMLTMSVKLHCHLKIDLDKAAKPFYKKTAATSLNCHDKKNKIFVKFEKSFQLKLVG